MIRSARHPHLSPALTPEARPQIPDYLQASEITLTTDGVTVTLLPDAGLRVGSIVVGGRELLVRESGHPATWGIFPMAPWAGRMANATFTDLAGATHQFPPTWGDHAFHGRLYQSSANEQSISGDGTSGVMYAPLDRAAGWPLNARAEVAAALTGNATAGALTITLTITADVEQLVTAGWHPASVASCSTRICAAKWVPRGCSRSHQAVCWLAIRRCLACILLMRCSLSLMAALPLQDQAQRGTTHLWVSPRRLRLRGVTRSR